MHMSQKQKRIYAGVMPKPEIYMSVVFFCQERSCHTCLHNLYSCCKKPLNVLLQQITKKKSTKLLHFENKITAQIQTTHCLIFLPININVQKQMFLFSLCIWALLLVCGCARIGSSSITQQLCK